MPTRTIVQRVCIAAALALACASISVAGFDTPPVFGGKGYKVVPVPATGTLEKAAQDLVDKVRMHFMLADDAAARAKCAEIFKNLCAAIAIVKQQNTAVGECLEKLKKEGKIYIVFGGTTKYPGMTRRDGKVECDGDLVNVHIAFVSGPGCPPPYDPKVFELCLTLLHEGTHCIQNFTVGLPSHPGMPDKDKAELNKQRACNEIAAHGTGLDWESELFNALMNLSMGQPEAPGDSAATKAIIGALSMLAEPARTNAIDALKKIINTNYDSDDRARQCYGNAKDALDAFLEAPYSTPAEQQAAKDALKMALDAAAWKTYNKTYGEGIVFRISAQSGVIEQKTSNASYDLTTPLSSLMDILFSPDETVMLVTGMTASGAAAMLAYRDTNNNGIFEPTEMQIVPLIGTSAFNVNMSLARDDATGRIYLFDQSTAVDRLWQLIDANHDGIPEGVGPLAYSGTPSVGGIIRFVSGGTTPGLIGLDFIDSLLPSVGDSDPRLVLQDLNNDGFFEQVTTTTQLGVSAIPPSWGADSPAGATSQRFIGHAGHPVALDILTPSYTLQQTLSVGTVGPDGVGNIGFSTPLSNGMIIALNDLTSQQWSIVRVIGPPPAPVGVCCWGGGRTCSVTMPDVCMALVGSFNNSATTCTPLACCPADFNHNGVLSIQDIFDFLSAWFAGNPNANFDGLNGLQVADIFAFLNAWFAGCS